jgi:hypothetical protein
MCNFDKLGKVIWIHHSSRPTDVSTEDMAAYQHLRKGKEASFI